MGDGYSYSCETTLLRHGCHRCSRRRPAAVELDNGRAVSGVAGLVRQHLRGTRTHPRTSTRACAPTMHTPKHISTALHKHDHCTFLHLHTALYVWQRCGRARRAMLGTGSSFALPIRRREQLRGLQPPQHDAAGRFAAALQFGGIGAMEARPYDHATCNGFLMLQWLRIPARRPRVGASAAHERVVSRAFALCSLVEVV